MTNLGSKKFSGKILGAANNSSKSTGSNEKLFKSMKQFVVFQLLFVLGASVVLVASSSAWAQQTFLPATQISGNLDGTITRNDFRISSDGERVVYLSNQNLVTELFSVPTGGGVVTRLSADLTFPRNVEVFSQISRSASPFQISPDNARVVYVSDQNTDDVFELYSVPIAGGNFVRLNANLPRGGDVYAQGDGFSTSSIPDFRISSDGERVVYVADQATDNVFELFSVPIEGGVPVRLNSNLASAFSDVVEYQISPDGQRVVYLADQNSSDRFELFSVPITGGTAVQLNQNLGGSSDVSGDFRISSDSERVVFIANPDFSEDQLFSVSITGGDLEQLNADLPSTGDVFSFQISADAQQVVYLADQTTNGVDELFSVPIEGGSPVRLNSNLVASGDVLRQFEISPDSQRVVYIADQITNNIFELFSAPITGGIVEQLNPRNVVLSDNEFISLLPDNIFDISPDGQRVVFFVNFPLGGGDEELLSVPIAGGRAISISPPTIVSQGISEDFQISPDGQLVLFTLRSEPQNLISVPILGGGSFERVNDETADLSVVSFMLSDDGQQIVYQGDFELFSAVLSDEPPSADDALCVSVFAQNGNLALVCL